MTQEFLEKKFLMKLIPNIATAAIMIAVAFLYFRENSSVFNAINVVAGSLIFLPFVIKKYLEYRRVKELEEKFPVFLRDFIEAIRGGMTVPDAFKSVSRNDYKKLSPHIKKIAAQLEWGIPVDKVLLAFSKQTKSKLIARIVSSVIESHRFGGKLTETFEALSHTAVEVDRLRVERKLFLQSQMMTGYIVYFVFLAVILGLETFLVPSIAGSAATGITASQIPPEVLAQSFREIFRNLILIEGLFAGLSVGKMAEGALIAGVKHSLFMMAVGGAVFFLFG